MAYVKRALGAASLAAFAATLLFTIASVGAASAQPFHTIQQAGTIAFKSGTRGVSVRFSAPMRSQNYVVNVQATNTAGFSSVKECTYFNVLNKTTTGFQVQHKTCESGRPVALDANISLDWMAVEPGFNPLGREVCYDGRILSFNGEWVGCLYSAENALGREDELCNPETSTAFKSLFFGPRPQGQGPAIPLGCLACIHGDRPEVFEALKFGSLPPDEFQPSVNCLGYFRFEPIGPLDSLE